MSRDWYQKKLVKAEARPTLARQLAHRAPRRPPVPMLRAPTTSAASQGWRFRSSLAGPVVDEGCRSPRALPLFYEVPGSKAAHGSGSPSLSQEALERLDRVPGAIPFQNSS